jgi:hypothetical protein
METGRLVVISSGALDLLLLGEKALELGVCFLQERRCLRRLRLFGRRFNCGRRAGLGTATLSGGG